MHIKADSVSGENSAITINLCIVGRDEPDGSERSSAADIAQLCGLRDRAGAYSAQNHQPSALVNEVSHSLLPIKEQSEGGNSEISNWVPRLLSYRLLV